MQQFHHKEYCSFVTLLLLLFSYSNHNFEYFPKDDIGEKWLEKLFANSLYHEPTTRSFENIKFYECEYQCGISLVALLEMRGYILLSVKNATNNYLHCLWRHKMTQTTPHLSQFQYQFWLIIEIAKTIIELQHKE